MNTPAAPPLPAHGGRAASTVRDAPAFDFYPERWLVGVAAMSDAEQISYLRLLCHQWLLGDAGLPPEVGALKRLAGKGVTPAVLAKLPAGADGQRRNARLEIIRREQRGRIAKASEKARKMAAGRWNKPGATPMPEHASCNAQALHEECPASLPVQTASNAHALLEECPPPTADHPPPTLVPEDANNAGAREALAAGDAAAEAAALAAANAEAAAAAAAEADALAEANAEAAALARARAAAATAAEATPDLPAVLAWAERIGCPPDKAEIWWHEHEARPLSPAGRWTDRDGNAVQRPQHALAAWWQKWRANDLQRATRLHAPSTTNYQLGQRPPRSDTANKPGRYA